MYQFGGHRKSYQVSNNPIAFSDSIFADSLGWNKVKLSFIATGNYDYLILGNFFDDLQTDTLNLGQFNLHSYYFIDDVCLSLDSSYCSINTGFTMPVQQQVCIVENYYFSSENTLMLKFKENTNIKNIEIYTIQGQFFKKISTHDNEIAVEISRSKLYLVKVISNQTIYTFKIF